MTTDTEGAHTPETKSKHTPEPWLLTQALRIVTERGEELAQVRWDDFFNSADSFELPHRDEAQALANGHLMKAAPALLEALKENMATRHRYGMWIARLENKPASHSEPIEECVSPGCLRNRAVIRLAEGGAL